MRKLSLALLAAAALTAATAASASANTYCVAPKTGCGVTNDFGTIASALGSAAASPGADTILLGAATYSEDDLRYDGASVATPLGAGPAQPGAEPPVGRSSRLLRRAAASPGAATILPGAATYSEDDRRYDGASVATLVGAGPDQ